MNKYFTVTLMYGVDYSEVLSNVKRIEITDTNKIIITHMLYVHNNWCRTKELVDPETVTIMVDFNFHEIKR